MPTKPSDLLNSLPSAGDLLDKPPIRALADRWNRSIVASGVRSFLDELRADLQRRAADAQLPSIRELAERAARHVVALQQPSERPVINATGCIHGPPWISTPLADAALERVFGFGRDFVVGPLAEAGSSRAISSDIVALLCRNTQAQSAAVVHSYAGAVWLALAALADKQEVVVSRAELGDVDAGRSLEELAASAGAVLCEVGSTNRTMTADYEAAVTARTAALLQLSPDTYRVVGETQAAELDELVSLARDRELALVAALGAAPLNDLPGALGFDRRSVRASLSIGVDLVLARGDGLIGGPPCGIVVGSKDLVAKITDHPLWDAWRLDALRAAALAATLECYTETAQGEPNVPVLRLLSAPLENLRDRAERLAPQLTNAPGIASAEAVATNSRLCIAGTPERGLPSYGVVLIAGDADRRALENRLRSAAQPILARVEGEHLLIDLRFVFPRQDQALVESIAGSTTSDSRLPKPAASS
jgi:L-seryl-tRNA(Ser) seleniumtransferase